MTWSNGCLTSRGVQGVPEEGTGSGVVKNEDAISEESAKMMFSQEAMPLLHFDCTDLLRVIISYCVNSSTLQFFCKVVLGTICLNCTLLIGPPHPSPGGDTVP